MDLPTIRPALLALVETLVGAGVAVRWEDQPRSYIPAGTRAEVLLAIRSVVRVGTDTQASVDLTTGGPQPVGEEIQQQLSGTRLFTLRCKCESLEQGDATDARVYAEAIRNGIPLPSSAEAMRAVNVALVNELSSEDLSYKVDDRIKSVSVVDLRLRAAVLRADPVRGGYIQQLGVSHTLTGEQD